MGCYAVLKEYQNYYCQQGDVKEFVTVCPVYFPSVTPHRRCPRILLIIYSSASLSSTLCTRFP
eukprot:1973182-Rhodomonas_salina.2